MHEDDGYDGSISISNMFDNPQDIPKENCLTACENAAIRNCQYSNDGECTFELKIFSLDNNNLDKNFMCEFRNDGKDGLIIADISFLQSKCCLSIFVIL